MPTQQAGSLTHYCALRLFELIINLLKIFISAFTGEGISMQKIGNITTTADANGEWTNGNVVRELRRPLLMQPG